MQASPLNLSIVLCLNLFFVSFQAESMLEDVLKSCKSSPECTIIFCDEMSSVVGSLDAAFLTDLSEKITTLFQDTFLVENTDPLPNIPGIPLEFSHGLDDTEEGTIALNLVPMLFSSPERVRAMAAHFHLLCMCVMAQNNTLEEIDALLGEYICCVPFRYLDPGIRNGDVIPIHFNKCAQAVQL